MQTLHFGSISEIIIGAAFEVHNILGSGFLERVYQNALAQELTLRGMQVQREKEYLVSYKDTVVGKYFADIVVNEIILVETKWTNALGMHHIFQVKQYLKAANLRVGLLLNFGA